MQEAGAREVSESGSHDRVAYTQKRTSAGIELGLYARQTSVAALGISLAFGNGGACAFKHSFGKDEVAGLCLAVLAEELILECVHLCFSCGLGTPRLEQGCVGGHGKSDSCRVRVRENGIVCCSHTHDG